MLWCCGPKPRNDEVAVRAAVASSKGWALGAASGRLRRRLGAERETVKAAAASYGQALGYASEELRDDRELVLHAVTHFG